MEQDPTLSEEDKSSRKRLFWILLVMDTAYALTITKNYNINIRTITVNTLTPDDFEDVGADKQASFSTYFYGAELSLFYDKFTKLQQTANISALKCQPYMSWVRELNGLVGQLYDILKHFHMSQLSYDGYVLKMYLYTVDMFVQRVNLFRFYSVLGRAVETEKVTAGSSHYLELENLDHAFCWDRSAYAITECIDMIIRFGPGFKPLYAYTQNVLYLMFQMGVDLLPYLFHTDENIRQMAQRGLDKVIPLLDGIAESSAWQLIDLCHFILKKIYPNKSRLVRFVRILVEANRVEKLYTQTQNHPFLGSIIANNIPPFISPVININRSGPGVSTTTTTTTVTAANMMNDARSEELHDSHASVQVPSSLAITNTIASLSFKRSESKRNGPNDSASTNFSPTFNIDLSSNEVSPTLLKDSDIVMKESAEHTDSVDQLLQEQQQQQQPNLEPQLQEGPEFQQQPQQQQFISNADQTDAKVAEMYFNRVHNSPNRTTGSDFLAAQLQLRQSQPQQSHYQSMPMSIDATTYSNSENGGSTSNDENNMVGYKPIHEIFAPQIGGTKTMNEYLQEIQRSNLGNDVDIGGMYGVGATVIGGAGINVGVGDVGGPGFGTGNEYMPAGGVNTGMNNFGNSSMNAGFGPVGFGVPSAVNQVPFGVANYFRSGDVNGANGANGPGMGVGIGPGFGPDGNSIDVTRDRNNVGVEAGDMNSYFNFGIGLNIDDELEFSSADFALD
ncbi:unnamed protein product [Ambrosiozyma monospora]|uniref:Unnamed protein product n=1 Tax=Ambrosiozyma monospora TaxID=43982 RepID=A0A9W7DIJ9_AMBMO|nr:unnamed protein product [Ambrosiozyma monospora]